MIKIKMKTSSAGPAGSRPSGWVGDVEDKEARALLIGGFAEKVETRQSEPVKAVKPAAETAVSHPGTKATRRGGEKRTRK